MDPSRGEHSFPLTITTRIEKDPMEPTALAILLAILAIPFVLTFLLIEVRKGFNQVIAGLQSIEDRAQQSQD